MLDTTKAAIAAMLKADPTLGTPDRARIIARLTEPAPTTTNGSPGRILKRSDVAALVGRSTRTIDLWRKAGLLKPVQLPGHSRALGYRETDVRALVGAGT